MANSPPGPEHLAPSELHQTRQTAESFGENAERHDRTRPRYPVALIDAVIATSPGPAAFPGNITAGTKPPTLFPALEAGSPWSRCSSVSCSVAA